MASESPVALIYGFDGSGYVETSIRAGIAVPSGQPGFLALGSDGTNTRYIRMASDGTVRIDPTGTTTQPVSAASLPLPTGAATETTLATLLTLAGFQARINTLGQKTMANSTPVVLASDQSAIPASQSGAWSVTATQSTAANLRSQTASESATAAAIPSIASMVGGSDGTNLRALRTASDGTVRVDPTGTTTQPISAASLPLPTGAATETTLATLLTLAGFQARINTLGQKTMANSTPVVLASDQAVIPVSDNGGSLTVDGTVNAVQSGSPWNFSLQQINGNTTLTGNGVTGTGSQRVTIASDNTPFTVNAAQSGTWNLTNISGTISLPTGAATSALQTTGNTSLGNIDTKTPALGQAAMASSSPVVIASNQSAIPVSQSGTWTVQPGNTANTTAWRVEGQKTHNNAAPGGNNIGVLPAVANTSAPTVTDGNQVALSTDLNGQLRVTSSTTGSEEMTYTVIATAVAPGNNKSLLSIYNPSGSGYVLKLREFYLRNAATTAVTGVAGNFQLHRFASGSAPTGGSTVTVLSHDSNDALPASMDARTGGTISGEIATPLDIIRMSTDEWGPGPADVESAQQAISNYLPARAKRDGLIKPFFARPGEGLHIKFATNSTAGSIDVVFVFTKV